jgi:hypothetical protein
MTPTGSTDSAFRGLSPFGHSDKNGTQFTQNNGFWQKQTLAEAIGNIRPPPARRKPQTRFQTASVFCAIR